MKPKNVYSITLSDIDSYFPNYRIWKNNKDVYMEDLTLEEIKMIADNLHYYHSIFMGRFNRLTY
jgi:hypothetical protein